MIIPNATIQAKIKTGGGIDPATGYARRPDPVTWGRPVPCQVVPITDNRLAVSAVGDPVTRASYQIFLDGTTWDEAQVRLTKTAPGGINGEFSVIRVSVLQAVNEVCVYV